MPFSWDHVHALSNKMTESIKNQKNNHIDDGYRIFYLCDVTCRKVVLNDIGFYILGIFVFEIWNNNKIKKLRYRY